MARINTYERDTSVSGLDLLVGSEYYLDSGVPKYRTKNYSVNDLSTFFGLNTSAINSRLSSYLGVLNEDGTFTYSTAFANQALTTVATAGYASASFVTNLGAIVGTLNADGTLVSFSQALADQTLSTVASVGYAASTDLTQLSANVSNNYSTTSASTTQINQAVATETSARASAITTLNTSISIKPNIIRAVSAPNITQQITDGAGQSGNITTTQDPAMGSLWIDIEQVTYPGGGSSTKPKNEMYVLQGSAGSASWLKTQDLSLLNVITSAATATSSLSTLTTADIAKAEQLTELEAQFTVESDGTISGVDPSKTIAAATNTARNTAIATANKASATRENNLTANVQKVFNQNSAPSVTLATQMTANVNSATTDSVDLAIDGQSSGTIVEGMVITGSGISGDVVVITVTNQNTLVLSSPQTLANNAVLTFNKAQSPPVNSLWYDTTDVSRVVKNAETGADTTTSVPGNILHVLTATGSSPYYSWVENPDALLATQASVNTTASATADINGKLSSRYGVKVTAGGVFAGMELLANSDATGAVSDIIFTSTNFKIKTLDSSGNVSPVAPFTVSGTTVSINGDLKIGSSTASSIATKANSATQASDYGTIQAGTTKANVGLGNVDNTNDATVRAVAAATSGTVAGWNISSYNINSGASANATQSPLGYAAANAGIIMNYQGSIHAPNFYINPNGSAGFRGTLTIGSTDLTSANALNENTSKSDVGLGNVDNTSDSDIQAGTTAANVGLGNVNNTSDDTVLGNAATASNTQDKTDGSVGGWTLDSNYIYSGTLQTSDGYSASGITLYSGGALRAKEFYIANNGDAFFKGDISAASGTFTGGLSGATISGGTISIGAATDYVFKASAAGIQLGNTNFASAEFSVTPGGVLKAISGTIGGWTLGSTTFTSANNKVTLSSADSNLPNIEDSITGQPSGTYNGSTTAYNHFYSTSNGGVSVANNYVGLSSGSTVSETSNRNTADGWGGGYPWSSISFVANSSSAGKPVTITVNVSNSNSHAYLSKIVTSGSTNSYSFSGSYQVKIVMGIYKVNSSTIASTTRIFGGTSPEEDSSGNLLIGLPDNYLMSVNLSSTTLVSGHTYYIRTGIQWVYIAGTFGTTSITGYRVYFATPRSSGGAIIYAIGRTEVIGGGLQVIKGSDAFLSLNRSQNTATNPFILSRGYSKHQGDLYIDGALDAASKNFKIKHPLSSKSSTHYLIHSSIESPRADLIYRGKVKIFNEVTVVNIDEESNMTSGTFEVLCRNVQCFTTNETSWGAIKARVEGNLLIITAKEVGSFDTISWMVVGERCDADIYMSNNTDVNGKLIVELEK